jgi:hypothetical protein
MEEGQEVKVREMVVVVPLSFENLVSFVRERTREDEAHR